MEDIKRYEGFVFREKCNTVEEIPELYYWLSIFLLQHLKPVPGFQGLEVFRRVPNLDYEYDFDKNTGHYVLSCRVFREIP